MTMAGYRQTTSTPSKALDSLSLALLFLPQRRSLYMAHESGLESADKSVSELTEAVKDYDIDPQAEKWLRRKLDWRCALLELATMLYRLNESPRILPIVSICYMFLFLDVSSSSLDGQ